jgi:hypothetical protein
MRKPLILLLLLGLCWFSGQGMYLHAQEQDENEDTEHIAEDPDDDRENIALETDWDVYVTGLYSNGDQVFTMSAGVVFPTLFVNNGVELPYHFSPPVGGSIGPFSWYYFFNEHFFLGGEVSFSFNYTLGQNVAFLLPLGVRAGWQFLFRRFEFPVYATIGMALQRYLNFNYLGLFSKVGASAFFRFNPDWSFGLSADFGWYPEWPQDKGKPAHDRNVDGFFTGVTLAARYHF